jgi:hypothetical protein
MDSGPPVIDYAVARRDVPPAVKMGRMLVIVGTLTLLGNLLWLWLVDSTWTGSLQDSLHPWAGWSHGAVSWPANKPPPWPDGLRFTVVACEGLFSLILNFTMLYAGLLAIRRRSNSSPTGGWACRARLMTFWIGPLAAVWWAGNVHDLLTAYNVEGAVVDPCRLLGGIAVLRAMAGAMLAGFVGLRVHRAKTLPD